MKILANDGLHKTGERLLTENGFEVLNVRVAQEQLANYIDEKKIEALVVRSATQVDKKLLENRPSLKLVVRAGVGMDNIDITFAKKMGIEVINTPNASAISVAELVMGHLYSGARYLHDSNRAMPLEGDAHFKQLKKAYSKGGELTGKTLGIIGFGRIGQAVARLSIGAGMKVIYHDPHHKASELSISFYDGQSVSFDLKSSSLDELLKSSDFITLHVPAQKEYIIGEREFGIMKKGVGIINAARGGVLDEVALDRALENEKVAFAGLDVYESEPRPEIKILMNPKISLSPHIGASTLEAQKRISIEVAEKITAFFK